jgi:hypothetical protein
MYKREHKMNKKVIYRTQISQILTTDFTDFLATKMHKMYKRKHEMNKKVFYLPLIHPLGLTIDDGR